jgi:hypothetical protein
MRSLKEIMNKTAAASQASPAGTNDALDQEFVDWMAVKASEDVVKVASCGADHKVLKSGERCGKCGEMSKTAAPSIQAVRRALSKADSKKGLEEAVQSFAGREKLKSLLAGSMAGGALTAGAGALYIKGRKDQHAKTAELEKEALSPSTIASAAAKRGVSPGYLKAMARSRVGLVSGSVPEAVKQRLNARDAIGPGVGDRYFKSWSANKPHMKSAGVIENPENLDLLSRVRALAAAQNRALLGD